jgi:hypothetical protein
MCQVKFHKNFIYFLFFKEKFTFDSKNGKLGSFLIWTLEILTHGAVPKTEVLGKPHVFWLIMNWG